MKHRKGIRGAVLAMAIALSTPTPALAQSRELITGSKAGDILLADLGGFGGSFAAVGLNFLALGLFGADGELSVGERIAGSAVTELSDIPLLLSGSPGAVGLSVGGAALWGAEALADAGYGVSSEAANLLYWGKVDLAMYKAYDSYAGLRLRSGAWDNSAFRRYGFMELMAAPLDYRYYARPQPWIALGAGLGLAALFAAVATPDPWASAVWRTGRWYSGETETNPAAFVLTRLASNTLSSTYTGVGEEAVYRGFLREELCTYLGKPWATTMEAGAFLAMHFFTDLARGADWKFIGAHMLLVTGGNLLFDWAYNEGGLPLAVVCHSLWDFATFCFNDLVAGGAP